MANAAQHDNPPTGADDLAKLLLEHRALLEEAPIGIAFTRERTFEYANPRFEAMFGWTAGSLAGKPGSVVWPSAEAYAQIGRVAGPLLGGGLPVDLEHVMERRDGSTFVARLRAKAVDPAHPLQGGTVWFVEDLTDQRRTLHALEQARDEMERRVHERTTELASANARLTAEIAERQQAERRIRHLAQHDDLTGLPNRRLLEERLELAIDQARRAREMTGVMFVDLDRFKAINDSLGHAVGDRLLKTVAERLAHCLRPQDTVSRVGGDEFVLVLPCIGSADGAAAVAGRVIDELSTPYSIDGNVLRVTPSIGISLYPRDGDEPAALIGSADTAMYRAKAIGRRSMQFYARGLADATPERLALENDLHGALERGELELHYQPRVALHDGSLCASEALLRWRHPRLGLLGPAEFIDLADDTGLIVPIGEWVIRQACRQNQLWRARGLAVHPIAVNLWGRQFRPDGRLDRIPSLLLQSGLEPRLLELEITESVLMHHGQDAIGTLSTLSALGLRIAIDDFGTGYSNLAHLRRFPVDVLKVDRSFVRDVCSDPDDAAIVQAIVGLAQSLQMRVVAEGVESDAQHRRLAELGCEEAQGYLFGPPMRAEDFARLLPVQVP